MVNTEGLADRWPVRESRSARVQTISGHWMWAQVRGRTAPADVEHVLVLRDIASGSVVGVSVTAVTGRFLRLAARGGGPDLEFGPVDVAVLRRLVREAAALPA